MVTKVTYVGEGFTRKPPKYERFIRPMVRTRLFTLSSAIAFAVCLNHTRFLPLVSLGVIQFQGLRFKKAHVTHPELKATFCLPIIGVKKNPSSPLYTSLGVITKGTVVEVSSLSICELTRSRVVLSSAILTLEGMF